MQLPETIGSPAGPIAEEASPELLEQLIEEFRRELLKQRVPLKRFLAPGVSAKRVREVFADNGLEAPEEAVVWYSWQNGIADIQRSDHVFPVFEPWSLEEMHAHRNSPGGQPIGYGEWDWHPSWMRFMGDANGLAMNCGDDPTRPPLIRALLHAEGTTRPDDLQFQVVSLCTPLSWWIDGLQRGWYRYLPESGYWEIDMRGEPAARRFKAMT